MSSVSIIEKIRRANEMHKTVQKMKENKIEDHAVPIHNRPHRPSKTLHDPNISPLNFNEDVDLSGNVISNGIPKSHVPHGKRLRGNPIDHALPNDVVHGNHIVYGGGFIIDKSKIM